MSCRDRLQYSGYRRRNSLPKSNRPSVYIPSTYSSVHTSNYDSTSSYNSNRNTLYLQYDLSYNRSNYRCPQVSLDIQTDAELATFDKTFKNLLRRADNFEGRVEKLRKSNVNLESGLERVRRAKNEDSAELEWKRFLDAGILIDKAVDIIKQRCRLPKAKFEYSPEGPSPRAYDVPSDTTLVSVPYAPSDDEDYSNSSST